MKKFKLIISFALILGIIFSPLGVLAEFEDLFDNIDYNKGNEIRVILEGKQLQFDVPPQILNGRVLVPMRKMFESFGLTVTWDDALRAAIGRNEETDIVLVIGSNIAIVNGLEYKLEVPAQIIGGSTMVPLRFLSENMNYNVVWNGEAQLILLSKYPIIEWKYGGFEGSKPFKEYDHKYINGEKTTDFRYTGKNHEVALVNLYRKDGGMVKNVPDFKVKDYGVGWFQKSPYVEKTYWVHIDELEKGIAINQIYLEQDLQLLNLADIKENAELGDYVKIKINQHYFDQQDYKKVKESQNSNLASARDEAILDGKVIDAADTLFKVEINDKYNTIVAFNTLSRPIFNPDSEKIYTVLEKSPTTLFNWDANNWKRIGENIPWTGMTKDMLLVQYKMKPDQTSKLKTKFNELELWIYTEDYGDSIYYFKDNVLTNIL